MSPASLDLRTLATVAIFVATYAGVALGRVPGLRIDRAGISLVGASLMIAFGTLSLEEAFKAVDLDAKEYHLFYLLFLPIIRNSGRGARCSRSASGRS
jgi:Na+/H+ antiporter NhaD/arsenite permease-like protein